MHGLIHVVEDEKLYGPVDGYSAYKFENAIQLIANRIRKSTYVLQQIYNRLLEDQVAGMTTKPFEFKWALRPGSAVVMKDLKTYALIKEKKRHTYYVKRFRVLTDFFTSPIRSSEVGIVETGRDEDGEVFGGLYPLNVDDVAAKCYMIPNSSDPVLLPLML